MNRRLPFVIVIVCLACGAVAPAVALRAHRARAIEAAMTHAVVLHRYLAERARDLLVDGGRTDLDLTPWITEPGVQAVWVVDAAGHVLWQRGAVAPAEVAVTQQAMAQPDMLVRVAPDGAVWLAQSVSNSRTCGVEGGTRQALPGGGATRAPVNDAVWLAQSVSSRRASPDATIPLGAVGCRFAPRAAVRAVGNPWGRFSYLLAIATVGALVLLVLWYRAPHGSAERPGETALPVLPAPPAAMGHDLAWAQAVVDVIALPVMVLDATHRLVAANGMLLAVDRGHALRRGMHWLDLVTVMGWGAAAQGWVQALERAPQRTLRCTDDGQGGTWHIDMVRMEQTGTIAGYWMTLEGVLHDPAAG